MLRRTNPRSLLHPFSTLCRTSVLYSIQKHVSQKSNPKKNFLVQKMIENKHIFRRRIALSVCSLYVITVFGFYTVITFSMIYVAILILESFFEKIEK